MAQTQYLKDALGRLRQAQGAIEHALTTDYPPGTPVAWNRGDRRHKGAVIDHGYSARIKVKNFVTGKEYWIDANQIA